MWISTLWTKESVSSANENTMWRTEADVFVPRTEYVDSFLGCTTTNTTTNENDKDQDCRKSGRKN